MYRIEARFNESTYLSVCQYDTGIPGLQLCIYMFLYGTDDTISTITVATQTSLEGNRRADIDLR
jgi:hypothetical protein